MKMFSRLLVTIVTILFIAGLFVTPAKADGQSQDSTPSQQVEAYVKSELEQNGTVNLANLALIVKFPDAKDRTISGGFVASLFADPELQTKHLIQIYRAVITEDINAPSVSIPFNIEFHNCTFEGGINLDSAEVKTFRIDDSTVKGSVRMGRLVTTGDLALYRSTFEKEVTLFDATIGGNLFARQSKFNGATKDPSSKYPFELWKAHVLQSTEFTGAVFKGEVSADYAVFGTDVKFDGTTFEQPARFKNVQFNDIADFRGATFKNLATFENSIIKRDIQFTNAQFNGRTDFKYLSVGRFLNFSNAPLNTEDFSDKELGILKGTIFSGVTNFEGVKVGDVLNFTNAKSTKLFEIHLAEVQGQTLFDSFAAPQGLDLSHNQFGDLIINGHTGGDRFKFLKVDSTKVNGDFELKELTLTNFSAQDLAVKDSTTFKQLAVKSELDLGNASLGSFTISADEKGFWPDPETTPESLFNLRGAAYAGIGVSSVTGNEPLEQKLLGVLLKKMVAASLYSPQAYQTLEKILTEKGRPRDAADMEYDRKVRERDNLTPWTPAWLLSWFRWGFSGYGKFPWLAFVWSMVLIMISTFVFSYQGDLVKGLQKKKQKQENSGVPDENKETPEENKETPEDKLRNLSYCFLYSFFLFFTFVVLEFAKDWEPEDTQTSFKAYKQFHKMLGLLIAPTAVLVFGGLIK